MSMLLLLAAVVVITVMTFALRSMLKPSGEKAALAALATADGPPPASGYGSSAPEPASATPARAALAGRKLWVAGALGATAIAAVGFYLYDRSTAPRATHATSMRQDAHAVTPQEIDSMLARLGKRLQANPNDGEAWVMMARSYHTIGRFPEAAAAFSRAVGLVPEDAQLLSDYADALAMTQGRRVTGEPERLVQRALAADPRNIKALALSGTASMERLDYAHAATEWRKALEIVPADSEIAGRFRSRIADAEARAAMRRAAER